MQVGLLWKEISYRPHIVASEIRLANELPVPADRVQMPLRFFAMRKHLCDLLYSAVVQYVLRRRGHGKNNIFLVLRTATARAYNLYNVQQVGVILRDLASFPYLRQQIAESAGVVEVWLTRQ